MSIYHYDNECKLTKQSEATYDELDSSINIPAHATTKEPLGAIYPDTDVFDITNNCWTINKHIEPIPKSNEDLRSKMSLSALQCELNLIAMGYQEQVLAILTAMPVDSLELVYWRRAISFERLHPMVVNVARQLGLSDIQLDEFFTRTSL
jgi:hypothetical protein